ncbi:MAG: FKBP-type peptidyl-prolyl cis-trans isomerase [Leadbetterella sp.]|nr:FKBP-type peptidyl-prolyl cis-trans isomerase [Leadbetterella sp.]
MKYFKVLSVLLLFVVLFSCEKDTLSGTEEEQIESYIQNKGLVVTEKTVSGLRYIRTKENAAGAILVKGKLITLNYTGKLLTGKKFDSGSFSFVLGGGQVIKGFDEGIAKMRIGESATLIFPSNLGYGSSGTNGIPGNSPLLFEIETLSVN